MQNHTVHHIMQRYTKPYHTKACSISYHAKVYLIIQNHTVYSYRAKLYQTISYKSIHYILSCKSIPYHAKGKRTQYILSCKSIPYHIIQKHTIYLIMQDQALTFSKISIKINRITKWIFYRSPNNWVHYLTGKKYIILQVPCIKSVHPMWKESCMYIIARQLNESI